MWFWFDKFLALTAWDCDLDVVANLFVELLLSGFVFVVRQGSDLCAGLKGRVVNILSQITPSSSLLGTENTGGEVLGGSGVRRERLTGGDKTGGGWEDEDIVV